MKKSDLPFLREELKKLFPDEATELRYSNDFQLLIAIMLSAQTTDKQVNKVTDKLYLILKTPEDGIKIGTEELKKYIRPLGFFNNKSKHVYETSKILHEEYNDKIPNTLEEITKLPGVGVKTGKVYLAVKENAPYLAVDTHVHRVLNRLGLVKTKTPLETDKIVTKSFPKVDQASLHKTLVLFGRYYCIARKPKCEICPLSKKCDYYKKIDKKK